MPIIALMENQIRLVKARKISAMALISDTTSKDESEWKNMKASISSIILTTLKILFDLHLQFWLVIINNKFNTFYC